MSFFMRQSVAAHKCFQAVIKNGLRRRALKSPRITCVYMRDDVCLFAGLMVLKDEYFIFALML